MRDFTRLLAPRSIAVIGGGAWCDAIAGAADAIGFQGEIWPVHPVRDCVAGRPAFRSVADLPAPPDAAFIGVNRAATLDIVSELRLAGAGGAVCFASGFNEVDDGAALQDKLVAGAGQMPILGPNCYGLINALDGAAIWPDQHGMRPVARGVAILTQSSNIALNLTMQRRGLPIAMLATIGNQAQTGLTDLAEALLCDDRITAIGVHVEGIADPVALYRLGMLAQDKGVPIVALKSGRSESAQRAAVSHTASMTGSDVGASALFAHCGIARVASLEVFLETLKVLHVHGSLPKASLSSLSCSGGEAALVADIAATRPVTFPGLTQGQSKALSGILGPKVTLANPLDYHTYIWRDVPAMTATFAAMADPGIDLVLVVADLPRGDACDVKDWDCVIDAVLGAARRTGARFALVGSLPESIPEMLAVRLHDEGIVTLLGFGDALDAIVACCAAGRAPAPEAPWRAGTAGDAALIGEAEAKSALAGDGLDVPRGEVAARADAPAAAARIGGPVALKAIGLAHKTEAGGVALHVSGPDVAAKAKQLPSTSILVEEMVPAGVELLVSVLSDPAHGLVLTVGAGGILAELMDDRASLTLPATRGKMARTIQGLRAASLLDGWRGGPKIGLDPILDAIEAIQRFAGANRERLAELEVNPLICSPTRAVAADAVLRLTRPPEAPEGLRDRSDSAT